MLHYVLYHIFDKRHYLAQFKKDQLPKRVLDIGCGTGIWIHDVAQEWRQQGHTDVEFHGVDLVPIQSPMVLPHAPFKTDTDASRVCCFVDLTLGRKM